MRTQQQSKNFDFGVTQQQQSKNFDFGVTQQQQSKAKNLIVV